MSEGAGRLSLADRALEGGQSRGEAVSTNILTPNKLLFRAMPVDGMVKVPNNMAMCLAFI